MNGPASHGSREGIRSRYLARLSVVLKIVLVASVVIIALRGSWQAAAATFGIALVAAVPSVLGEIGDYYTRFWWWDVLLHPGSGFLLGILGFVLVYALNQKQLGNLRLEHSFLALFAFSFAVALGGLWEVFEFSMDQLFGLNMQKTGLMDTMGDLIVAVAGAALIALLGYGWLQTEEVDSFLERWIQRFMTSLLEGGADRDG